jgi:hypothetical protein
LSNTKKDSQIVKKSRDWWGEKMGDAFARRLFDDAHFAVNFGWSRSLPD